MISDLGSPLKVQDKSVENLSSRPSGSSGSSSGSSSSGEDGDSSDEYYSDSDSDDSGFDSDESYTDSSSDEDVPLAFELEGWELPAKSMMHEVFISEMKVGYQCKRIGNTHAFSYPFWSIGMKLKRNDSIAESIAEYFEPKQKMI